SLAMAKVGYNLTSQWKVTGAAGSLMVDNGTDSDDSVVLDLQASYQVNKAVRVWGTAGYISSNKVATLSGNPLIDSTPLGGFADHNVSAGSVNMEVKF
ncbi:MAG: hypothetical protein R3303_09000, partial [Marinobacter sp.]|nr:hypothetical protein [Marinobacter sp.]